LQQSALAAMTVMIALENKLLTTAHFKFLAGLIRTGYNQQQQQSEKIQYQNKDSNSALARIRNDSNQNEKQQRALAPPQKLLTAAHAKFLAVLATMSNNSDQR
jgi:hypothetical protein